ncbi:MAG: carbohydrate kinase family protein, partial [Chloroflexota bacterium]
MSTPQPAVVAGHICLDLFPDFSRLPQGEFEAYFQPGRLVEAGPVAFATGGPVANTGLALHRLGIPVQCIARVGDDQFGKVIRDLVSAIDPHAAAGILPVSGDQTSYSVIISPPGVDRIILHHPGANDHFSASDIRSDLVEQAALFHFGYPPLMCRMYQGNGEALEEVLGSARQAGAAVSLDMAFPGEASESAQAGWRQIFQRCLPLVDIFLPSIEELLFLYRRETYLELLRGAPGGILAQVTPQLLSELSAELIGLGVKIVVIKLGERGLYLRCTSHADLSRMGRLPVADPSRWANVELWSPCFQVDVVGTNGSGDATIAG